MTKAQFKKLRVGDKVRLSKRVKVDKWYGNLTLQSHMAIDGELTVLEPPSIGVHYFSVHLSAPKGDYFYTPQMIMPI